MARRGPLRDQIVELMRAHVVLSAGGIVSLLGEAGRSLSTQSAHQAIRKGMRAGLFEPHPGAPGTYKLTTQGEAYGT